MKLFLLLATTLFTKLSLSQTDADTVISKWRLDSLETVVYKLTDSLRRTQYENWACKNYSSIDSIVCGTDSVVLNYRSDNNRLIKRHTKKNYDSDGSFDYEKIEYCNRQQLPEFVEHWETARFEFDDKTFKRRIYSYERFAYDSLGRKITWIKFYPAVSRNTVRRVDYHYALNGAQTYSMFRLKIEKFWD